MALTYSEPGEIGSLAPDFYLPGVDGKTYKLKDFESSKALVIVFMCNHCPYVQAVNHRINNLAKEYKLRGVKLVGINPNDAVKYPDDSFDEMKKMAAAEGYVFPYLRDEDQSVARAYGAVCTPDFYVYKPTARGFELAYRGRLDDNWKDEKGVKKHDLAEALEATLSGRQPPSDQPSSMGCSIKWK
ncbi:MAG: thioredoxin family protein [Bdellovibrionota bacterium]